MDILQDARLALRRLRASPAFTLVAAVTLALGIGANTAVFTLVNRILFRPLPVERPAELVFLNRVWSKGETAPVLSYLDYKEFRDRNDALSGLVAYRFAPMTMSSGGRNARLWGYTVSGNYFEVLGVKPAVGRLITPEDDQQRGAHPVAVISYAAWQSRFGGDPQIAGKDIKINGLDFTILGVAPREFSGTEIFYSAEIWAPMMMAAQIEPGSRWLDNRSSNNIFVLGRVKPGVSQPQAAAALNRIAADLAREYPASNEGMQIQFSRPGLAGSFLRDPVTAFAAVLMGVTGLVLLIACTNLAGLLLARASDRRKEIAIRLSLGASRVRLLRQLLTESLVLSLGGAAVGLLLAFWLTQLAAAWRPPGDLPIHIATGVDGRVLLFTLGVAGLASLLFGLTPAFQTTRANLSPALRNAAPSEKLRRWALRDALVTLQVALSVVLLAASVLVVGSLRKALHMNVGFNPQGAVTVSFDLALHGYNQERGLEFQRRLLEKVRALPGIDAAAFADRVPLGLDYSNSGVHLEGKPEPKASEVPLAFTFNAGPGFFRTMQTRLLAGREFDTRDRAGAVRVAVVNEAFVKKLLPGEDPIGKRFKFGRNGEWLQIAGVVETGKYFSLGEAGEPAVWEPLEQDYSSDIAVVARSRMHSDEALRLLRRTILDMDPDIAFYEASTLEDHMRFPFLAPRVAASALGAFGAVALLLAATGVYGLMAYAVARRTREIGIRVALGAKSGDVVRLLLGRTAVLLGAGGAAGAAAAFAVGPWLKAVLYDVNPRDPATIGLAVVLMTLTGLLACWAPARRALAIAPSVALREE